MTPRLLLFLLLLLPLPAAAALSPEEQAHAKSAFALAAARDWDEARAHAAAAHDPIVVTIVDWQRALDQDSKASFDDIARFIHDHPDWPEQKRLRLRAEMSLRDHPIPDADVLQWFALDPPVSGIGKLALAEALTRTGQGAPEKITAFVREAWIGGDFEEAEEQSIRAKYNTMLRPEDDIARADRLLWDEKIGATKRMLSRVPPDYRKLYGARMMLIEDKKNASVGVKLVPASLKNDLGLLFDRLRYRARRGDDKGVREILLSLPAGVPYPERWWRYREQQVREAIDEKNYAQAEKILARHGLTENAKLADAAWLKGWLELEFLNRPAEAYQTFYAMYHAVRFPVSKARAAFWAARAAGRAGNAEAAAGWYAIAAGFPTTFYGQLGFYKYSGTSSLKIPAPPEISIDARQRFQSRDLAQAVKRCAEMDAPELADRLIAHLIETANTPIDAALSVELARETGKPHLGVRAAKKASQEQNVILIETGWPVINPTDTLDIEEALALAVARQESEFDPQARSPSDALGLMQLLPRTAREMAHKMDMIFHRKKLFDGGYNMKIGSHYLSRLIGGYDGSYVMAIAAYNAGPGNVRKWIRQFGTPGSDMESAIMWIEKIPFAETRNYVQRVMENLQVYRYIKTGGTANLSLAEDLAR